LSALADTTKVQLRGVFSPSNAGNQSSEQRKGEDFQRVSGKSSLRISAKGGQRTRKVFSEEPYESGARFPSKMLEERSLLTKSVGF